MQRRAQTLISFLRTIVLAGVSALLITSAALPMCAQNTVPPTAVQAAKMPQFAKRLAHPAARPASPAKLAPTGQASHNRPPQNGAVYENGPINGNVDAWTINFGFTVSNTFTVTSNQTPVSGMSFGAWLFFGDTLTSAELSITSEPNGGTSYFDQTVNFTQGSCAGNLDNYNVCTETTTFNGPTLNAGTYWVNLQNASVPNGDPVYWDENSGVGCMSSGCPSQAEESGVGTIPSESFTITGEAPTTCYESQGNLQILYNFTQQQAQYYNQGGVAIDKAGNLYGTTYSSGNNGAGFAYKLAHFAGWVLDPLFSFFGGNNGGQPTGAILGPNGTLYGGASGGIQNCGSDGSQYCGLVYNLTPPPTACVTALCGWDENVPYRFSSNLDGFGTINVTASDQQGNLYGTTSAGGTYDSGTVFELTPSAGGWTKTILYTFMGGSDGGNPSQVIVGNDGNLYGISNGVHFNPGAIFQLTPSGGRWKESVLYTNPSFGAAYLAQGSNGDLYGISGFYIFVLDKSSGWTINEFMVNHTGYCSEGIPYEYLINLAMDASGNLYGTGTGGSNYSRNLDKSPPGLLCTYNYAFKASYSNGNWSYQDLDFLGNTYFDTSGTLALDPSGNLYGTTYDCGANGVGTVWQLSP